MAEVGKVIYIPGLGADHRLFFDLEQCLPGDPIKWPNELGSNLSELASTLITLNNIQDNDLIIGFSFGGQIAKEIVLHNPKVKAVAISSVKHSDELTFRFKLYATLMKFLPESLLKFLLSKYGTNHASKDINYFDMRHFKLLRDMSHELEINFFKQTLKLCSQWKNNQKADVFYIHGENDIVIPFNRESAGLIIPRAGHLLVYTHPKELSEEIMQYAKSH